MQITAECQIALGKVFFLVFYNNVFRVSNIALGKQLSSARSLTLNEAASVEYLFLEWATTSALALSAFRLSHIGWLFFHLPICDAPGF
jgi:hypothetical protein